MTVSRIEAPSLALGAVFLLRRVVVSLSRHHPLPCPFLPPSCLQRESGGGEIFRWVRQDLYFCSKAVFRVFPIHKPFENLGEKKKNLYHTKVGSYV